MDELYQSQILALARAVRTSQAIAHPSHSAIVKNPTCGDEITIDISIHDGQVRDVHIAVEGCALCEAGAGLLYKQALTHHTDDIRQLGERFSSFLAEPFDEADMTGQYPEAFTPFTALRDVKNRHKCITLAFAAFEKAVSLK